MIRVPFRTPIPPCSLPRGNERGRVSEKMFVVSPCVRPSAPPPHGTRHSGRNEQLRCSLPLGDRKGEQGRWVGVEFILTPEPERGSIRNGREERCYFPNVRNYLLAGACGAVPDFCGAVNSAEVAMNLPFLMSTSPPKKYFCIGSSLL